MTNNLLIQPNYTETGKVSDATLRNWSRLGVSDKEQSNRLTSRANKRHSQKIFSPGEYVADKSDLVFINEIVAFSQNNHLDIASTLFLSAMCNEGLVDHPVYAREMLDWEKEIPKRHLRHSDWFTDHVPPNAQGDFLGLLYQSLLAEGIKAKMGSYYTPRCVSKEMVAETCSKQSFVLDPACGTGQFLLEAANVVDRPEQLYGIDSDPIAVRICRINLIKKFSDTIFEPHIYCADTLLDFGEKSLFEESNQDVPTNFFDLVITNPPWGGHWEKQQKTELAKKFPQISSGESFAYFLIQAMKFTKKSGTISFLLPEAFLNIKVHSDIRNYLLDTATIKTIKPLRRLFAGVFSPVVRLDVVKDKAKRKQNTETVFSIFQNTRDRELLEKIDQKPSLSLKGQAKFALGIVTGNNEKHVLKTKHPKSEPIFRGKNVQAFRLQPTFEYIIFQPDQYQQVAPEELYRAKEKLIYKFISQDLVFAYDDKQCLTLNSANTLIPEIPNYPAKVLCAVLNSNILRFYYRKKYNALKVLRGDLESLPIPNLSEKKQLAILSAVECVLKGTAKDALSETNDILGKHYKLTPEEISYINDYIENN